MRRRSRVPFLRLASVGVLSSAFALVRAASGAQGITLPPNGENPQASVMQAIGPVRVTIEYSSPRVVRGSQDRRGKIWGELVPWGLSDLGLNREQIAREASLLPGEVELILNLRPGKKGQK